MKHILSIFVLMLVGVYGFSQSQNQNYIKTTTYINDGNTAVESIQYFDGLGRPVQTVQKGITPQGKDLVTLTEYDAVGREQYHWLPKTNNGSGAFVPSTTFKNKSEPLYNGDSRPFSETVYEHSALSRVEAQKGPGYAWSTHPDTILYQTNPGSEVKLFVLSGVRSVSYTGYYPAASLYKTVTADEDGKTATEYKDKLGRVVMTRQAGNVDTYYIYNDLGQLAIVLPPLAADANGSSDAVNKYAYCYEYDNRGNCISKKLPGCEPIWMAYDKANRMVCSQDGNQRAATNSAGKRSVTLSRYDVFGRAVYTAVLEDEPLLSSAQAFNNTYGSETTVMTTPPTTAGAGYSTAGNLLTVNYYDNYNFINLESNAAVRQKLTYQDKGSDYSSQHSSAKGLLTGTRTYLLDNSGKYTVTAYYYDERGNIVQERSTNYLGGYDITYHKLDFTGKPKDTLKEHNIQGQAVIPELYTYYYDDAGRLTQTKYKLKDKEIMLADNTYDELGRLTGKTRHNGTDTELYNYNIRGWTTEIKSGDFHQKLYYEQNPYGGTPQYNGNISYQTWTYGTAKKYGYAYRYDELNRLSYAQAYSITGSTSSNFIGYYENFGYDKHGNINRLIRMTNNKTLIDYINIPAYQYDGNRIIKVNDNKSSNTYGVKEYQNLANAAQEMFYDANGNLTADLDREIVTIKYNLLNLPEVIQFKNGCQIKNTYDAAGRKLSTRNVTLLPGVYNPLNPGQVIEGLDVNENDNVTVSGTDYTGDIEYSIYRYFDYDVTQEPQDLIYLDKIYNPEGYVSSIKNTANYGPVYNYYRRDHLGSIREVWHAEYQWGNTTKPAATVQRTQYYPSGLPWAESFNANLQQRKYNGKEWIEAHGLDEYDSQARMYYPAIKRTDTMDPLCEKYYSISPYAWCGNNVVNMIDPDGRDILPVLFQKTTRQGHAIPRNYRSSSKYIKAMTLFGKTSYGRNFIGSFLNKGEMQYGVKGSGKNSNYTFRIKQYDMASAIEQGTFMIDAGGFNIQEIDGKLNIIMKLDVKTQSYEQLVETIVHELTLHGSEIEDVIKIYEEKGIDKASEYLRNGKSGHEAHRAIGNKNKKNKGVNNYYKTRDELLSIDPKLQNVFDKAEKEYEEKFGDKRK